MLSARLASSRIACACTHLALASTFLVELSIGDRIQSIAKPLLILCDRPSNRSLCRAIGRPTALSVVRLFLYPLDRRSTYLLLPSRIEWSSRHISCFCGKRSGGCVLYEPTQQLACFHGSRLYAFQQSSRDGPALQWTCAG